APRSQNASSGPRAQSGYGAAGNGYAAAGPGAPRANGPRREQPRDTSMPLSAARKRSEALALLGLSEGATLTEVKKTFRDWAVKLHPDRHVSATDVERDAMARRFAAMSAAYHVVVG
ncbi:MAG: DnaJ domain-containing protein, partial [Polyangiaceae bacterium]